MFSVGRPSSRCQHITVITFVDKLLMMHIPQFTSLLNDVKVLDGESRNGHSS